VTSSTLVQQTKTSINFDGGVSRSRCSRPRESAPAGRSAADRRTAHFPTVAPRPPACNTGATREPPCLRTVHGFVRNEGTPEI